MWPFKKKEKKEYHFVEYVVSSNKLIFANGRVEIKYFISTKDSDGIVDRFMYSDEVCTLELANKQIEMLNKVIDYESQRYTIKTIFDDGELFYSYYNNYNSDVLHERFRSSKEIVDFLNSNDLKVVEYTEEVK